MINRILTNLKEDSSKFAGFIAGMGLRNDFRTTTSIAFIDALARLIAINGETMQQAVGRWWSGSASGGSAEHRGGPQAKGRVIPAVPRPAGIHIALAADC